MDRCVSDLFVEIFGASTPEEAMDADAPALVKKTAQSSSEVSWENVYDFSGARNTGIASRVERDAMVEEFTGFAPEELERATSVEFKKAESLNDIIDRAFDSAQPQLEKIFADSLKTLVASQMSKNEKGLQTSESRKAARAERIDELISDFRNKIQQVSKAARRLAYRGDDLYEHSFERLHRAMARVLEGNIADALAGRISQ